MKITKTIVGLSLIVSSLFGDISMNDKIQVSYRSMSGCEQDLLMGWKNTNISPKGKLLTLQDMKYLNLSDVSYSAVRGSFKSYTFFTNGFLYDNKVYKFEKNWSQNFMDGLREDYRFIVACGVPTETVSINRIEDSTMMAEWNQINLTADLQKEMEKWVIANAKEIVLNNSLGAIEVNNDERYMVTDVTNIEDYKQKTLLVKQENEKVYNRIIKILNSDEIERNEASKVGKLSVSHITPFMWKKYKHLDEIEQGL